MPDYKLGWKRQKPDARDYRFTALRRVTANLPSSFDLTATTGPYLDQGNLGSCGPNTAAEAIDFDQKVENIPIAVPSRLYIYYNTRSIEGTTGEDSGVNNRDMLKSLHQYGFCPETLWPYDTSKFTQQPPKSCYDAAQVIDSYAAVQQTLDQMKGCIASGFPFIFGFDVFQQIMSAQAEATGIIADPSGQPIGGHDMLAVAYDDAGFGKIAGGALKLRNHWTVGSGKPWGDGGYGYVSYAYATGPHASDFWVINAVPSGAPPGPPNPPPGPGPTPSACRKVFRGLQAFERETSVLDWITKLCGK